MRPGNQSRARVSRRRSEPGFSLTELLVVIALMGVFITFAGPAFNESYRAYKVRSAALELTDALRAARQVAVTTRTPTSLAIDTAAGTYSWTDSKGKVRTITLTTPVHFVTASPATVTFVTNGTVSTGSATIALQNNVNSSRADRWTLTLNTVGRVTSAYSQVAPS